MIKPMVFCAPRGYDDFSVAFRIGIATGSIVFYFLLENRVPT